MQVMILLSSDEILDFGELPGGNLSDRKPKGPRKSGTQQWGLLDFLGNFEGYKPSPREGESPSRTLLQDM